MQNPVIPSLMYAPSDYVKIDSEKIREVAESWASLDFKIPSWQEPVFLQGEDKDVIDFFFLGNCINFAYTDFESGIKFSTEYKGKEWRGAFGMWACLERAIEEGKSILNGSYLAMMSRGLLGKILKGNIEIPMLTERAEIFREVGDVLIRKYNSHFHNLVEEAGGRLFNNGKGVVERLVTDFPSFDDSVIWKSRKLVFNKRAQLAPGMLYGRFLSKGVKLFEDVDDLIIFADYVLPMSLRNLGILKYEKSLADKVDSKQIIPANSQEEIEIRASTVIASQSLINQINNLRKNQINVLHIDYKLWSESHLKPGKHHLTITTNY